MKKKLIILTGAGISAESGIPTFRDAGGLWEGYEVTEVASPEGWENDMELVLEFYNTRRRQMRSVQPNEGHNALVKLEEHFDTTIITQNIDDLHERAGSSRILHLHGQINQARSTVDPSLIYEVPQDSDINLGDNCEKGSQLRPHIVWFGEDVPELRRAAAMCNIADVLIVVGTSMVVYPANTLVDYVPNHCKIYVVDPKKPEYSFSREVEFIVETGSVGVPKLVERLITEEVMKDFL